MLYENIFERGADIKISKNSQSWAPATLQVALRPLFGEKKQPRCRLLLLI